MSYSGGNYTSHDNNQCGTTNQKTDLSHDARSGPSSNTYTSTYEQNLNQFNSYNNMSSNQGGGFYPTTEQVWSHDSRGFYGQTQSYQPNGQYPPAGPPYIPNPNGWGTTQDKFSYSFPPPFLPGPPNALGPPPNAQEPPPNVQGPPPNVQGPRPNVQGPPPNVQGPPPNVQGPPPNAPAPPPNAQGPPPNAQGPPPNVQRPHSFDQGLPTFACNSSYSQDSYYSPQGHIPNEFSNQQCSQNKPPFFPRGKTYDQHARLGKSYMPPKLKTSFKQASAVKKTAAPKPPTPATSLQPLTGGKSAVSALHEFAIQQGYTVQWSQESETGPAHSKLFTMKVNMGPYEAVGSGRSKKLAKQDAAQTLITQLTGDKVAQPGNSPTGNSTQTNSTQSAITSEEYGPQLPPSKKTSFTFGTAANSLSVSENPVSMLDHIAKKHHLGEPLYVSITENGPSALTKFDIKVKMNNMESSGMGRSKKVAKRNAAQAMLDQLSRSKIGIEPPTKRIMFVRASSDTTDTQESV